MLVEITWGDYLSIVFIILTVYYSFVFLRYYRDDIRQLLSGGKIDGGGVEISKKAPISNLQKVDLERSFEKLNPFQLSRSLSDEVQAYLSEAGRNSFNKTEVMNSLRQIISKYPAIKDSAFYPVIQNIIKTECESNCSIHLSEEELSELW